MSNAQQPDAPVRRYVLRSFINELKEEGYAMVEPVTSEDVEVYAKCSDALDALAQLIDDAAGPEGSR
jgi:hypothetical protein